MHVFGMCLLGVSIVRWHTIFHPCWACACQLCDLTARWLKPPKRLKQRPSRTCKRTLTQTQKFTSRLQRTLTLSASAVHCHSIRVSRHAPCEEVSAAAEQVPRETRAVRFSDNTTWQLVAVKVAAASVREIAEVVKHTGFLVGLQVHFLVQPGRVGSRD